MLTVIAFVGHVFSPAYYQARQTERGPVNPTRFCALNVALHGLTKRGRKRLGAHTLWALSEYSAPQSDRWKHEVHRTSHSFQLGQSVLSYTASGLTVKLSEPTKPFFQRMPRRVEGEVKLTIPHAAYHTLSLDAHHVHTWMGVSPSARVEVSLDQPQLSFKGHAYHDSNWGEEPLEDAFSFWTWSRASLSEGTLVVYDVTDKHSSERVERALLFHESGGVTELDALQRVVLKRGGWGVKRETRADQAHTARLCHALVDAPFYTRDVIEVELLGQSCLAVHEALDLERFMRPWVRFLIPFRVRRL